MEIKRKAHAVWNGTGKEGKGTLTTPSNVLKDTQYSFKTRFEDGNGTNPEELVAAAHAGCFSMKLAFVLQEAGGTPESIETEARVTLADGYISKIHLTTKVKASGIDKSKFDVAAAEAKETCPISKSLTGDITLDAELV